MVQISTGKNGSALLFRILFFVVFAAGSYATTAQSTGDFRSAVATGNWSNSTSWQRYNSGTWEASGVGANNPGQIPSLTSNVTIQSANNITVDITTSACKDISWATTTTCLISFNANTILNVYGNLNFGSTTGPSFSTWPSTAKLVMKGTAAQTVANQNPNNRFVNLEIDKSSGAFTFSNLNAAFDKITLTAGTVIMGSGDLRGTTSASININGGTWTQTSGANRINGGSAGTDLGTLNVNSGIMTLATTSGSPAGYNIAAINVTGGGTLNLNNGISNMTVSGTFSVDNTSFLNSAMTTTPSGATTSFSGTVNYNHSSTQNIINTTYKNLTLSNSGNKNTSSNLTVTGDLNITGAAVLPLGSLTLNLAGNWAVWGAAGFTGTGSTVDFNSSGSQSFVTIGGESFFKMKKSGSGTLTLGSDIALSNTGSDLTISAGTLNSSVYSLSGTASTSLNMSGTAILKMGMTGATQLPDFTPANITLAGNSVVELSGSGTQILKGGIAYRNLTFRSPASVTIGSNPTSITGDVYIAGATLDIGSSNGFGDANTNLVMDGGRFKMSGTGSAKPDIDGLYTLTGGIIEFNGSSLSTAQPIKGRNAASSNIIYKNIEVTGTNVGTSTNNIYLNSTDGNFTVKSGGSYAPNTKSVISSSSSNNSTFVIENGGTVKTGNNRGFSGYIYSVPDNSAIDNNISSSNITLNAGSTVDYGGTASQIITNQLPYQNLTISAASGSTKTAPSGTLSILGNFNKSGAASFAHNNGTVSLDGTSLVNTQSISAVDSLELYKMVNNNITAVGVTAASGDVGIHNLLTLSAGSNLFFTSGYINIRSAGPTTAAIDQLGSGATITYSGTGRFRIERSINYTRKWQLLTVPVTENVLTSTFKTNWMENSVAANDNLVAGYGMQITKATAASGSGFDANSPGHTIKYYNPATDDYTGIGNTTDPIATSNGYYVYVRGDRTSLNSNYTAVVTKLRAAGKIITGAKSVPVTAGKYEVVGNPYASAVDLRSVGWTNIVSSSGKGNVYVWDPTIGGTTYGLGKYVLLSYNGSNYIADDGTGLYNAATVTNFIQSGQAFFAKSSGGTSSVNFTEANKTTAFNTVSFTDGNPQQFRISMYTLNNGVDANGADGAVVLFGNNMTNALDHDDAEKMLNTNDNLAFKTENKLLGIERRHSIAATDTLHLDLSATRQMKYRFITAPENLDEPGMNAYLADHFTDTKKQISLTAGDQYDFTVTADPLSAARDRFMIIFERKPEAAATEPAVPVLPATAFVTVSPNPVEDGTIHLQMSRQPEGKYALQLINAEGKTMLTNTVVVNGAFQQINIPVNGLQAGVYLLNMVSPAGERSVMKVMVK